MVEVVLYGKGIIGDEMDVFIQEYPHDNVTNDDFKEQFIKYARVYNNALTDEEINKYWDKIIEDSYENRKLKKINIWPNVSNGRLQYFKIEGNIEFKNK